MRPALIFVLIVELIVVGFLIVDRLGRYSPPPTKLEFHFNWSDSLRDILPVEWEKVTKGVRDRDTPAAWYELVSYYLTIGFYPEAEVTCRVAHERWPGDFPLAYQLGICFDVLGRTSEAIEQFEIAQGLTGRRRAEPARDHRCWFFIGRNHLREERPEEALAAFYNARDFPPIAFWSARTLMRLDRLDEAEQAIAYLASIKPEVYETLQLSGQLAELRGDHESAASFYARAGVVDDGFVYNPVQQALGEYRTVFMGR